MADFPFQAIRFDADGQLLNPDFADWARSQRFTDLFVFSHGWNNDEGTAMRMYSAFFREVNTVFNDPGTKKAVAPANIGTAGVIWPSILWPEDQPAVSVGGAASLAAVPAPDLVGQLKKVFVIASQQRTLENLGALLNQKARSEGALKDFKAGLRELLQPAGDIAERDNVEKQALVSDDENWQDIFDQLADQDTGDDSSGGAAGLGDRYGRLWRGAKNALRVATYWQMKERAGVVGQGGLGPLIAGLGTRIHLIGHSFGARLVSYSLKGLPDTAIGANSPVKSLYLLQGAFSHFAFADSLPFDPRRRGDLAGMAALVDGPLVCTHSLKDSAVGTAYPLASVIARQDASAADDQTFRWGAMGHDGAQAVNAATLALNAPRSLFHFAKGKWLSLDGNQVIVNGGPPSGAHSDIIHPETAWVALAAAGMVA